MKTKMEKALKSSTIKDLSKQMVGLMAGVFAFQMFLLVFCVMFKESIFIVHVVAFLLVFVTFMALKENAEDSSKRIGLFIAKLSMTVLAIALLDHMLITALENLENATARSALTKVILFSNLSILLLSFGVWRRDSGKNFSEALMTSSVLNLFGEAEEEIKPGDAVLGIDTTTKKPVILPVKDRYLHSLILGPTGSGKTSQSIIPMINRDIQNPELGITVIEPKGDLAETVWAMAKNYDRNVQYFRPTHMDCPYFNPLSGDEADVIENMATTFMLLADDSPQFFKDMNDNLIRKSLKVLKRLYGDDATLLHFDALIHNTGGDGEKMISEFSKKPAPNETLQKENRDIAAWFKAEYLPGAKGGKNAPKTYEHCSGLRSQVAKLTSNTHLRRVLNPPMGVGSELDFDKSLEDGLIVAITTDQGKLGRLGSFLGYFIIFSLQSAVFRRPGNENTRRGNMLYIDEFQVYSNPGFENMLTQGRSYRVASHLATQTRALIGRGGSSGKDFLEVVSTNARNVIIYPGGSPDDNAYYERYFGTQELRRIDKGVSRKKFSILHGFQGSGATETSREVIEEKSIYNATEINYQQFGFITYRIIKNNSVQKPGISQVNWIPKELNEKLTQMVLELNEEQARKQEEALIKANLLPSRASQEVVIPAEEIALVDAVVPISVADRINIPDEPIFEGPDDELSPEIYYPEEKEEDLFNDGVGRPAMNKNESVLDNNTWGRGATKISAQAFDLTEDEIDRL